MHGEYHAKGISMCAGVLNVFRRYRAVFDIMEHSQATKKRLYFLGRQRFGILSNAYHYRHPASLSAVRGSSYNGDVLPH
jgi:hypothetical protein